MQQVFITVMSLTLFIYDFISRFDYYITPEYYFMTGAQVLRCVFPFPHLYHKLKSRNNWYRHKWNLPFTKIFVYVELEMLKYVLSSLIVVSAAAKQLKAGCWFKAAEIFSIQTGVQSVMLWE